MTIPSATNRSGPYNGNGVTTVFDYDFKISNENHIKAIRTDADGTETILAIDADYVVSDVGNPAGGQVALTAPLAVGKTLLFLLNVPFTQETDLENQGPYYAETVEAALDLAAQRDLQLQEQISRAVMIPASEDAAQLNGLVNDILRLADSADNIDTVADNIDAVNDASDNMAAIIAAPAQAAAAAASAAAAAADRVQTGLDRTAAAGSAAAAAASAASINLPAIVADTMLVANPAGTGYLAKAKADVRNFLAIPVLCADVAAVQALDITKDNKGAIIWNAGLRNGRLNWSSANLSAQVTADPNQYTYIAPASAPTGASGAWVYDSGLFVGQFPTPAIRSERSKMQDYCDLRDWNGLDLTGVNDNATLMQAAMNAVAGTGNALNVPAGTIALGSQMTWPAACHIKGPGQAGRELNGAFARFHIAHTGIGFKTTSESISDGAGSSARSMKGVNFKRTQPALGVGWAPTAHGYDVQIIGCYDVAVEDCMFLNPTNMLQIVGDAATSRGAGRVTLRNLKGQPFRKGIDATNVYDGCFFDAIHLWPFWSFDANVTADMQANATAFNFGRCDNLDLGRMFAYGYQLGMGVYQQAVVGAMPGGSCNYLGCDTMYTDGCTTGLLVTGDNVDLSFNRFIQAGMTSGPTQSMRFFGNNGRAFFSRLSAIRSNSSAIYIDGGVGNLVTVVDYDSLSIDADATGDAEFLVVGATNTLRLMNPPKTSAATKYGGSGTIVTGDFDTGYRSVLSADRAGADVATAQNVFAATEDTITLLAGTTYEFEAQYMISRAAGTTSHTFATLFGGTATFTSIDYLAEIVNPTGNVLANQQSLHATAATATVLTAANTSATEYISVKLKGEMRVNAAGTVIPQFQYSAAPGGAPTIKRNSFFNIKPVGAGAMVKNGPWS
ncbi:hypothetical protein EN742_01700 [Mesorhizobium sp. M4A.F.Ca.ET.020.02.1.1]|uniref:hypothetical protein n=1 Tax=Mesorhizobium sp. M4A.F.Ca.ET.020.02.1.1 TaxID=2496652 RepID=UPI000FD5CA7A|nr:hypothetical protein [Mesorhizobium sp. M4A.F.Ca.ET.020.02.1.1]RVD44656.1 hypothetical protein EN742_01700 [Mesorhizobium sp. M4A.F.Ca.ET.020.02.1.1]